ncbi:MAG: PD40 domain-containing protein [Sedimentisphaerales bacterium]|nr:PD40 domain-containing protein [Sedimentisphaerales bacterium]
MKNIKEIILLSLALTLISGCCPKRRQTVSPDTQDGLIAFSRLTGGYWQIWTVRSDSKNLKQITTSPIDKRYPVWSINGRKLFYRTNNNKVYKIDLESKEENAIFTELGFIGGVYPNPAGSDVLAVRYDSELKDSADLWLIDKNNERRIITRDKGIEFEPCWSPDGRQIIYINSHGFQTSEIYITGADGKNKRRLTNNNYRETLPQFSPDGKTIAYSSEETGDYEIWLMNLETRNRTVITESFGIDTRPYFSPDGSKIVFTSNRSGVLQLWIINIDGTEPRQLTFDEPSMDPAWRKQ